MHKRTELSVAAILMASTIASAGANQPGSVFRDCADCPEMVMIPAGEFMMGSPGRETERDDDEGPQRSVVLGAPFAVGKFEVTFAEWDACVIGGGCKHKPSDDGWGRGRRPVINVSWHDVTREYLPWLSKKTGKIYRLLTEAEWEYTARAGTRTPFSTGAAIVSNLANFNGEHTYGGSTKGVNRQRTMEVGSFKPNAFGLYDMHGNVAEWVEDCYHESNQGAPSDGSAWTTACSDAGSQYVIRNNPAEPLRVIRGGSWNDKPINLRAANRYRYAPAVRLNEFGFRVATTLSR